MCGKSNPRSGILEIGFSTTIMLLLYIVCAGISGQKHYNYCSAPLLIPQIWHSETFFCL
jgi:hypothetical protein